MEPIRVKIGYNKNITVKQNGQFMNVYINDNVFEKGQLDRTNSKSVWLTWKETLELKNAINSIQEQLFCMEEFSVQTAEGTEKSIPSTSTNGTASGMKAREHQDKTEKSQRFQPYKKN